MRSPCYSTPLFGGVGVRVTDWGQLRIGVRVTGWDHNYGLESELRVEVSYGLGSELRDGVRVTG